MFHGQGRKTALLIANTYINSGIKELPTCRNDIDKIHELLTDKLNFKSENIIKKYDVYPEKELNFFLKSIRKNDIVFIYFAGHGADLMGSVHVPASVGLMSSWINPDKTYFFSYYLDILLRNIQIECKIILCSDSCYSGRFLNNYTGKNPIYFIGASDLDTKTASYSKDNTKYGALVLLFIYLLENNKDIIFEDIFEKTLNFRKKEKILKYITLIKK